MLVADSGSVFIFIFHISNVNFEIFFEFDTSRNTRGHSLKLKKKRFNTELRQHFFTDRIINLWNSLDEQIVSSTSLNYFKNGLEKLRKQRKLMGHTQSCFGYWSPEAEPVPTLVSPRPGEWWDFVSVSQVQVNAFICSSYVTLRNDAILVLHVNIKYGDILFTLFITFHFSVVE